MTVFPHGSEKVDLADLFVGLSPAAEMLATTI
jgi:hypothetical protein